MSGFQYRISDTRGASDFFKEREQSANERKHSMDRVNEITATFSKTVLDIVARNKP